MDIITQRRTKFATAIVILLAGVLQIFKINLPAEMWGSLIMVVGVLVAVWAKRTPIIDNLPIENVPLPNTPVGAGAINTASTNASVEVNKA
jgi:hypothetical protein